MRGALLRLTAYGAAFCVGACFSAYGFLAAAAWLFASDDEPTASRPAVPFSSLN
jgi:hypothetical protein